MALHRNGVADESVNEIRAGVSKTSFVCARYEYELVAGDQLVFAESDREVTDRTVWLLVPEEAAYVFSRGDAAQAAASLAEADV